MPDNLTPETARAACPALTETLLGGITVRAIVEAARSEAPLVRPAGPSARALAQALERALAACEEMRLNLRKAHAVLLDEDPAPVVTPALPMARCRTLMPGSMLVRCARDLGHEGDHFFGAPPEAWRALAAAGPEALP